MCAVGGHFKNAHLLEELQRTVRCKLRAAFAALGLCPSVCGVTAELRAAVPAPAGRALKNPGLMHGRRLADAKHDCDSVRIASWFQVLSIYYWELN